MQTFEEMFEAVRNKNAEIALVPIENSRAGRVADTQRLIPESNLKIIGEYFLEVNHCLLALPGTSLKILNVFIVMNKQLHNVEIILLNIKKIWLLLQILLVLLK